jgi:hypothetical protein
MVGIATFTIVVSSTDMNMPTMSTSSGINQPRPESVAEVGPAGAGPAVMTSMAFLSAELRAFVPVSRWAGSARNVGHSPCPYTECPMESQ